MGPLLVIPGVAGAGGPPTPTVGELGWFTGVVGSVALGPELAAGDPVLALGVPVTCGAAMLSAVVAPSGLFPSLQASATAASRSQRVFCSPPTSEK